MLEINAFIAENLRRGQLFTQDGDGTSVVKAMFSVPFNMKLKVNPLND